MSTLTRDLLVKTLTEMGLSGKKVSKKDLKKSFGAAYQDPEWILLMDYQFNIPRQYIDHIEAEEDSLGRQILPTSYSLARFGKFLNGDGDEVAVDGLVYQYSMQKNPRNVHYAFRVFVDSTVTSKNSGLRSLAEAKDSCAEEAKKTIESTLYDLA